jgi:pyruvate-formate lyase
MATQPTPASTDAAPHETIRMPDDWDIDRLLALGEYFGAGYLGCPDERHVVRMGAALRCVLENTPINLDGEGLLVPCGPNPFPAEQAVYWYYGSGIVVDEARLAAKKDGADPGDCDLLDRLAGLWRGYSAFGWQGHSIVHFGRILHEGLAAIEARIEDRREDCLDKDPEAIAVYDALLELIQGIYIYVGRYQWAALQRAEQVTDPEARARWARLADALTRVPKLPAESFYEAVLATNVLLYLDGDDLGRVDQFLEPYYALDRTAGAVTEDEVEELLDALWRRVEEVGGWNAAIGGTTGDGESAANPLTYHAMRATARVAQRRPNLALRVSEKHPDELLLAALDTIATGRGMPALYNEELYVRALSDAHLGLSPRDLREFAFGGCTEIMIHGRSNCGSLDASFNALQMLELALNDGIHRQTGERRGPATGKLADFATFEQVTDAYRRQVESGVARTIEQVNESQRLRAERTPNLVRTLLIDDCVERGREFHAGGARYNWSVVSIAGLANVGDSLAAIKHVVFDEQAASLQDLHEALARNFDGCGELLRLLKGAPKYGNDQALPDGLVADAAEHVFREFRRYAPWRGGRFLPSCIMFVTYGHEGAPIGATPDGRRAGEPVADSIGAVAGRDHCGPTALLKSVTRIDHSLAPGTLILNLRVAPSMLRSAETREKVVKTIRTFFGMGGMQIQINIVDQDTLVAARENPEAYRDLIVRVGGYSEYFTRLDPVLQESIIERIAHEG